MNDDGGLTPEEREMYAALNEQLDDDLDDDLALMGRLAHEDPCGVVMFGTAYVDDDGQPQYGDPAAWLDNRSGKPLK